MKIAIASSGLGHVARGIETWALDTARALSDCRPESGDYGLQTTDFTPVEGEALRTTIPSPLSVVRCLSSNSFPLSTVYPASDLRVTLFSGATLAHCGLDRERLECVALSCLRRSGRWARWLARLAPGFAWRWGLKSPYGWEQWSFWLKLRRELKRGAYDILHVQDPMLAHWCKRDRERGRLKTQEVLAHGTEESSAFRAAFPCVQELAPWHLDTLRRALGTTPAGRPLWTAMPNFVDTEQFRPCRDDAERGAARREWNVPEDAFVVGCVAALKREHKRVDALISECARVVREASSGGPGARLFLLAAGAATADTPALQAQAARELGGRACLLSDVTRERMASLYRCMDVFVLPSLFEMMPIAVLEAMASGVPVIANRHPVLEWMVGDAGRIDHRLQTTDYGPVEGEALRSKLSESAVCCLSSVVHSDSAGCCIDMGKDGELAACLAGLGREWLEETGAGARRRAMALFSKEAVVGRYVEYYGRVLRRVG